MFRSKPSMTDEVQKKERDKEKEEDTSFTVDSEISRTVEVPSINKLLNRKTLIGYLRQNPPKQGTQIPVSATEAPPEPVLQAAQPTNTTLRNAREDTRDQRSDQDEAQPTDTDLRNARYDATQHTDTDLGHTEDAAQPEAINAQGTQNADEGTFAAQPTNSNSDLGGAREATPPTDTGLRMAQEVAQPTNLGLRKAQEVAQPTNSGLRKTREAALPANTGLRRTPEPPQMEQEIESPRTSSGGASRREVEQDNLITVQTSSQIAARTGQTSSQISSKTQVFRAPPRGATGTGVTSVPRLIVWTLDKLRTASEPIQQGISVMFQKGAQSALFLTIHPPQPGSPLPHFIGYATVGSVTKEGVWTGLQWNPVSVPKIWNQFVKQGFIEIPPSSNREYNHPNLVRAAYGVSPNEWLLLARVGTEQACRGLIAFVSTASMTPHLKTVAPMLATSRPRSKK